MQLRAMKFLFPSAINLDGSLTILFLTLSRLQTFLAMMKKNRKEWFSSKIARGNYTRSMPIKINVKGYGKSGESRVCLPQ